MALKPIAKTLSRTLRVLEAVREAAPGTACFCADLTVCPVMQEWNKNVAAGLPALPGLKVGAVEANGAQNYANWAQMLARHPRGDAPWASPRGGLFRLDDGFYRESGGVFLPSPYYDALARDV